LDWPLAISKNRQALQQIIAALFMLSGLTSPRNRAEVTQRGLPRHVYAAILLILRPAESAVRRLILLVALCGKSGTAYESLRAADSGLATRLQNWGKLSPILRAPAFALFDTLKSFDPDDVWSVVPASQMRFQSSFNTVLNPASGFRALADSQEPVPAAHILGRLAAISCALENLPRQARRLVRWQARRYAALKANRPTRITPFRPGLPPGWRQRPFHEVDFVLRECHGLATDLMNAPDTG
jgi:hypothetical protein